MNVAAVKSAAPQTNNNLEAGFGAWPLGLALLQSLVGNAAQSARLESDHAAS